MWVSEDLIERCDDYDAEGFGAMRCDAIVIGEKGLGKQLDYYSMAATTMRRCLLLLDRYLVLALANSRFLGFGLS